MLDLVPKRSRTSLGPAAAMIAVLILTILQLGYQNRIWWCACGQLNLWSGNTHGPHNSQHLFDPYSFTHFLHGLVLCGIVAWGLPKLSNIWRLGLVVALEALWEVVENSQLVIQRYRAATISLDYTGDSIANSLGDILSCGIGCVIAWRLGLRRSTALFFATELVLLLVIKDSLLLNIVMLLYPLEAIKAWQAGH